MEFWAQVIPVTFTIALVLGMLIVGGWLLTVTYDDLYATYRWYKLAGGLILVLLGVGFILASFVYGLQQNAS